MKFDGVSLGLLLLVMTAAVPAPAHAEALRCGNHLIKEGDPSARVLKRCGEPSSSETVEEPVWVRRPNGSVYRSGTFVKLLWYYDRGSRKFPVVLTIIEGKVDRIEFIKG